MTDAQIPTETIRYSRTDVAVAWGCAIVVGGLCMLLVVLAAKIGADGSWAGMALMALLALLLAGGAAWLGRLAWAMTHYCVAIGPEVVDLAVMDTAVSSPFSLRSLWRGSIPRAAIAAIARCEDYTRFLGIPGVAVRWEIWLHDGGRISLGMVARGQAFDPTPQKAAERLAAALGLPVVDGGMVDTGDVALGGGAARPESAPFLSSDERAAARARATWWFRAVFGLLAVVMAIKAVVSFFR